jgi:hypothetical protein
MTPTPPTPTLSKPFQRILPESLAAQVQARLTEIYAHMNWPENSQLRWHLQEYILPGLALYQHLRADGLDQEAALAQIDHYFEALAEPGRRKMKRLGRLPMIYPLLRVLIKPAMRQYPSCGWQLEWVENSSQAIRFNMRSCFYYNTLKTLGAPELTAAFCRTDDLAYGEMSAAFRWQRTQTIGRGAELCDFCFIKNAKP